MRKLSILFLLGWSLNGQCQDMGTWADSLRTRFKIPAIGYAVVKSDTLLTLDVRGVRRNDTNEPVQAYDYFHIGSNTKAMTAYVAARLVAAGLIRWDTPFFELFPEDKENALIDYRGITLEKLLSHRAGIPAYTSGLEFMNLPKFTGKDVTERRRQFARHIFRQVPVKTEPYGYSNAGYTLASLMLTKVTGKA
ncbi:MAG: serine hydrolase [Siphonobacter sp.]